MQGEKDDALSWFEWVFPEKLKKNWYFRKFMKTLRIVFLDLMVICFFASQEMVDTSNLKQLSMNARFEVGSIIFGAFWAHIIVNLVLITILYLFSRFCMDMLEGLAFASIVIYFICFYEFLFSILLQMGTYLDIDAINSKVATK